MSIFPDVATPETWEWSISVTSTWYAVSHMLPGTRARHRACGYLRWGAFVVGALPLFSYILRLPKLHYKLQDDSLHSWKIFMLKLWKVRSSGPEVAGCPLLGPALRDGRRSSLSAAHIADKERSNVTRSTHARIASAPGLFASSPNASDIQGRQKTAQRQ